jgi:hypothetical protein
VIRALFIALLLVLLPVGVVVADNNVTVANKLTNDAIYISPSVIAAGHASASDKGQLRRAVDAAGKSSVSVKVALVMQYPSNVKRPHDAADHLRNFIDFSGVLVLVSPHGIGVSSDYLSSAATARLERKAAPFCSRTYAECAVRAINASVPEVKAEVAAANRNVAIFWAVAVIAFGILITVLVLAARRRQLALIAEWGDRPDEAPVGPPSESA